jgi:hypothetical protein
MSATVPPITAEDIGRRVLKLIDSLRDAQDLAPERIEQVMGLRVEINDENPNIYGVGGKLTEDWSYSLESSPDRLDEKPTSLRFSFDNSRRDVAGDASAVPAALCGMRFEDYSKAMQAAGFTAKPMRTFQGSDSWYFNRGNIGVTAYALPLADAEQAAPMQIAVGQTAPARAVAAPACLSRLVISAYA